MNLVHYCSKMGDSDSGIGVGTRVRIPGWNRSRSRDHPEPPIFALVHEGYCNVTYPSNSKMMCPWIVPDFFEDNVCTNSCWVSPLRSGLHVIHVLAPVLVSFVISCQASEFRQDSSRFHHNCLSTIHKLITLKSCLFIISEKFWFKLSLLDTGYIWCYRFWNFCCLSFVVYPWYLCDFVQLTWCDSHLVICRGTNHCKMTITVTLLLKGS